MPRPNITIVPRFFADAGYFRFLFGITQDKAKPGGAGVHLLSQRAREVRTDQILILSGDPQINGQSCMMLAGADFGDKLMGIIPAPFSFCFLHDYVLLGITAPAADEGHFLLAAAGTDPGV